MLRPRWYKVLHDLFGNKTRTTLIVLSMAVGLFAIGIIVSARSILSVGLSRSFADIHPSAGTVRTAELFGDDFLESVRAMREVQAADARRSISARVEVSPGRWKNITLFVVADYDDMRVNKVSSEAGEWPPPFHAVLIERAALPVIEGQIGESVRFKLPGGAQRTMRIAGSAHDPAQLPAQIDGSPYGYVSFDTLNWLGEPYGFNELHIISTESGDKAWAQQVVNLVKHKAERSGFTIPLSMTAEPGQLPMNDVLQGILLLMGMLGILSLFLSAFLVVNTVSALLAQQRRQIGVMKAVGGGSIQILGMYLVMVISYGVLALLVAIPIGRQGARALSVTLATFFNFDLGAMLIPAQATWLQIIIGLLLPVLASAFPFLTGLRMSAAEAMNVSTLGRGGYGQDWIDKFLSGSRLWFAQRAPVRSVLLSLRNTFRSKGRLALTLLTLTLASATFISVFNVRASLSSTIDDMIKWFRGDALLTFEQTMRAEKLEQEALRVPGITMTDVWLQLPTRRVRPDGSESRMMYLFAPTVTDHSLIGAPAITAGRWLLPGDHNAVVVSSGLFLDEPDLDVGGELVLQLDGRERPFKIVGTYVGPSFAAILYANYEYVAREIDRVGEADAIMVATTRHDPASAITQSQALEDHYEKIGVRVSTVSTMQNERIEAEAAFDAVIALLIVMAILLALVGGLGLMGTMSINVLERTREIGVLRAIGAPNRSVGLIFVLEGVMIGLLSWLLGALLAIPASQGLNQAVGAALLGSPLRYSYSLPGLFLWLVAVIVLSALASYIPARTASRLTVREVLAYE
jgi:putative ABC transport system permease protein